MTKPEPWYIHAGLYAVIVILIIVLIKVAIIDPKEIVSQEKFNRKESRLRMTNLKEAEILYERKYGRFTDNLDTLINFIKHDPMVDSLMTAIDSMTMRSANPFKPLSTGDFTPDSLYRTPGSKEKYIVKIDTSMVVDTVVNQRGRVLRVDSTTTIGSLYLIEDPDGYGSIGSIDNDAYKNTSSWE
ncbi:MAG: hypothetical protein EHM47_14435 [Ignavibacteriales bacterium]|nr:MAG: hypothetical protein EHM47_14435 [Ignavibacteriales bacterium]